MTSSEPKPWREAEFSWRALSKYSCVSTVPSGSSKRSMKLPAAGDGEQDRSGLEGQVLERIFLIEEGIDLINRLFCRFVTLRASEQWPAESAKLRQWITKGAALATA